MYRSMYQPAGTAIKTEYGPMKAQTVNLFGDSFSQYQQFSDMAGNSYQNATIQGSIWAFALAELGDAIDVQYYSGNGGDTAQDLLDRLTTAVLNQPTDWLFGNIGVNDFFGYGYTGAAVAAQVQEIITKTLAAGTRVLWHNCYPQASGRASFSAAKSLQLATYNQLMAEWAPGIEGLIWVDMYSLLVDQNDNTNGAALTNTMGPDGIHVSLSTSILAGRETVDALAPHIIQTSVRKDASPMIAGDYGTIPFSNFIDDVGDGIASTDASGVVPDDWVLKRNSGEGTVVGVVDANGDYELQINKTTAASSVFRLQSFDLNSFFSGGESIISKLIMSADPGTSEIEEIHIYWYVDNSVDPFYTVPWGRSINGYNVISPITFTDLQIDLAASTMLDTPLTDVNFYIDVRVKGIGDSTVTLKNLKIMDA